MAKKRLELQHITVMNLIFSRACLINGLSFLDVKLKYRKRAYVDAKRMFAALMYEKDSDFNLMTLSDYMGVNHATILHYIKTSKDLEQTTEEYKQRLALLKDYKKSLFGWFINK